MYDGHVSHFTYQTVISAMENGVIIFALLPHSSHAFQPLDVGLLNHWKHSGGKYCCSFSERQGRNQWIKPYSQHYCYWNSWWKPDKSNYLVKGFCVAVLWQINEDAAQSKLTDGTGSSDKENNPNFIELSSQKKLRVVIMNTIAPNPSKETDIAFGKFEKA